MELIKTKHDGKKVLVIGNHPHKDCTAICLGAEWVSGLGKHGMKFKRTDTGEEFFIFDRRDVRFIS